MKSFGDFTRDHLITHTFREFKIQETVYVLKVLRNVTRRLFLSNCYLETRTNEKEIALCSPHQATAH